MSNPYVSEILKLLDEYSRAGASDVHFLPGVSQSIRFRSRIDGKLRIVKETPPEEFESYRQAMFKVCKIDPQHDDDSQDTDLKIDDWEYRVSYVPNTFGGSIVLRVREKHKKFDLESFSMPKGELERAKNALSKTNGIILVTGPTGSGKTTYLMNSVSYLNDPGVHIYTIEQPVEHKIDGVNQVEIEEGGVLTFDRALRAALRQDPDVILIGETRDEETAKTAVRAANTGHLVATTMHTNSAALAIERFVDLGVDRKQLLSCLRYVSGQQLKKRLCPHCKKPDLEGTDTIEAVTKERLAVMKAEGCDQCGGSGIKGRALIFESITVKGGELDHSPTMLDRARELVATGEISAQEYCSLFDD